MNSKKFKNGQILFFIHPTSIFEHFQEKLAVMVCVCVKGGWEEACWKNFTISEDFWWNLRIMKFFSIFKEEKGECLLIIWSFFDFWKISSDREDQIQFFWGFDFEIFEGFSQLSWRWERPDPVFLRIWLWFLQDTLSFWQFSYPGKINEEKEASNNL